MSDSDSSALSSARSEILEARIPATASMSNGNKKRKREVITAESTGVATKKSRTKQENVPAKKVKEVAKSAQTTPRSKAAKTKVEVKEEVEIKVNETAPKDTPKRTKKSAKEVVKVEEEATPKKGKKSAEEVVKVEAEAEGNDKFKVKVQRRRKTKEEKKAEAMPLAARTLGSKVLVGAHVSSAGGVHNAVMNSIHIGGNAFALFLKSQRKWENPPLQDEHLSSFMSGCKDHKYGHHDHIIPPIVPHGSYLVNLAHPDPARTKQAYDAFLDDLKRCSRLGIRLYNFHPGSCGASESRSHAISHLAKQLNKAHKDPSSGNVITLLETMTSSTNILGATFEDLAETIDQIDDKQRIGVCLDTCHVFAAGYDLRTPEAFKQTIDRFDEVVGLKYLRALHMNDSKAPLNSGRDLHANIGAGFLGLRAFHNIMNEPRLWGLPMILETPIDVKDSETGKEVPDKSIWAREIKLLESLMGMDVESEEFKAREVELHEKGTAEREKIQAQVDKKVTKAKDKEAKAKAKAGKSTKQKGKKQPAETSSDDGSSAGDT